MTGREALEAAMLQLGATKQQIKNQTVDIVLKALSLEDINTKALFKETLEKETREMEVAKRMAENEYLKYCRERGDYFQRKNQLDEKEEKLREILCEEVSQREKKVSEREKEVARKEELYQNVEICETVEAKDKVRLAEYYKKSVAGCSNDKNYVTRMMAGLSNILGATRNEYAKENKEDTNL